MKPIKTGKIIIKIRKENFWKVRANDDETEKALKTNIVLKCKLWIEILFFRLIICKSLHKRLDSVLSKNQNYSFKNVEIT